MEINIGNYKKEIIENNNNMLSKEAFHSWRF